jgi:hypothetical protein
MGQRAKDLDRIATLCALVNNSRSRPFRQDLVSERLRIGTTGF